MRLKTSHAEELLANEPAFDALAEATPGIDAFCSSTRWVLPAWRAFGVVGARLEVALEDDIATIVQVFPASDRHLVRAPLDTTWGLASPVLAANWDGLIQGITRLRTQGRWCHLPLFLAGLPRDVSFLRRLDLRMQLLGGSLYDTGEAVRRVIASLEGGVDGFLSRRARAFRKGLRQDERDCQAAGVTFEVLQIHTDAELDRWYPIIQSIESRSWKSVNDEGANAEPMQTFVHGVLRRCVRHPGVTLVVARVDGVPVGYLHGALLSGCFRGFQMSFDDGFRCLGLGNRMQLHAIEWLCEHGATSYDLGRDLDYKYRWGELTLETRNFWVVG